MMVPPGFSNHIYRLVIIFLVAWLAPAIQQIFDVSSYTQGLMLAFVLILFLLFVRRGLNAPLASYDLVKKLLIALITFITIQVIVASLMSWGGIQVDYMKSFLSSIMLFFMFFLVPIYVNEAWPEGTNQSNLRLLALILAIFFVVGLMGVFKISLSGLESRYPKPVVFYSEPSHFAWGVGPFLFAYVAYCKNYVKRWVILLAFLLLAILLENVTLLSTVFLATLVIVRAKDIPLLVAIVFGFILILGDNIDYYVNRLPIYSDGNIANLIYLQGVEEAYLALARSYGLGLGFQQFGIEEPNGYYAQLAYAATGANTNQFEGSIGGVKVIAEFGIVGIVALLFYLYLFFKSFLALRRGASFDLVIAHSFITSFFIYLFVRGGGYFSPNYFYFLSGIYMLFVISRNRKKS